VEEAVRLLYPFMKREGKKKKPILFGFL